MLKNKEIIIKSSLTELYKIEDFVESVSDIYNINNNYYSTILVSLNEAVRNAIEHGNKFDSAKLVYVRFRSESGKLIFSVKDMGEGFQLNAIQDPTIIEGNTNVGKGIFLMKNLSDNFTVSEEGNEVCLHFKISSINKDLAILRYSALKSFFVENKSVVKV